jgi:hypothetical protein
MRVYFEKLNWARVITIAFTIWGSVCNYPERGLWGILDAVVLVWTFYGLGYWAAETDRASQD